MYSSKALKIFVEPDEEIVFILEKIKNAESNRVIMIVPTTAALISSAVSLKILSRQLLKSNKLAVLVSDNRAAFGLGEKAGLVVTNKVSEVTNEIWLKAKELKEQMLLEADRLKSELLGERREPELKLAEIENLEKVPESVTVPVKATIVEEPVAEVKEVFKPKPRLKGRVIDVGKLKIYSGGDITDNPELLHLMRDRNIEEKEVYLSVENPNQENEEEMDTRNKGILGQDVIEQLNSAGDTFYTRKQANRKNPFKGIQERFAKLFKLVSLKKFLLGFTIAFIAFFLVSYFVLASVNITITLSENQVTANKSVTAKTEAKEIDYTSLIIPAVVITKESTLSSEAATTGTGYTGEYAQGTASFINLSNAPVTIKAGTEIIYQANNQLKYTVLEDVVLGAQQATTKTIKALNFGEEYNLKETLKEFTINGFASIDVQNITFLSGGTKSEIKTLSKQDMDELKASMEEQLKNDLLTNIKNLLSGDDLILLGSEKFTTVSFTTSVNENAQADSFTADLKMNLSALKITKSDIKTLLAEIVKTENGVAKVEVADPVLENIVVTEGVATFDVKANADTANDVDLEQLKSELLGKSVTEAKEYIKNINGVEEVIIRYSPPYIPQAMQKIPDDPSKVFLIKNEALE